MAKWTAERLAKFRSSMAKRRVAVETKLQRKASKKLKKQVVSDAIIEEKLLASIGRMVVALLHNR